MGSIEGPIGESIEESIVKSIGESIVESIGGSWDQLRDQLRDQLENRTNLDCSVEKKTVQSKQRRTEMSDILDIVGEVNREMREHEFLKEGQAIRQGDVYLVKISDKDVGRKLLEKTLQSKHGSTFHFGHIGPTTNNRQIVADSTLGSRHTIRENYVIVYDTLPMSHLLEGPVIESSSRFTLDHPEHASHSLPEGTYQVLYQRDWAFETIRRVAD